MAVTEDGMKANTAHALGVMPNDVTVSNRQDSGIKTTYIASTKDGRNYSCYMTGTYSLVGKYESDAICTPMASAGSKTSATAPKPAGTCNALLSAAGKC